MGLERFLKVFSSPVARKYGLLCCLVEPSIVFSIHGVVHVSNLGLGPGLGTLTALRVPFDIANVVPP